VSATGPLRVLRVIARLNIGGPARHVTLLNAGLRRLGHDALLVHGDISPGEGTFEALIRQANLPAHRLRGLGRRISPWGDLRAFWDLLRLVHRTRPDVVHTHTAKAGVLGRMAAAVYNSTRRRRRRCLVVHTFHGHVFSGYFSPTLSALVRFTERLMGLLTDTIIVVAEQQRREIIDRFRIVGSSKVAVVPLGLDLEPLANLDPSRRAARAAFGYTEADVVFGFVGRFVPVKDLPTMVRGIAAAASRAPSARLMMVGDGEIRADVEVLALSLGISHLVRTTGWRHDLPTVYQAIDVGILSSVNEGTPVALIEAMAAARPVVSTRVGGVSDLVKPGLTGLLVEPGDVDGLANGIVRLATDAQLRRQMGDAARADVVVRYGQERLVEETLRLYEVGLKAKRGAATGADPMPAL
jgi:glycosyltransferase involved in cell wall biosynthesis